MAANLILVMLAKILSIVVLPIRFITITVLAILVAITFGILLFPISLICILFTFPLIGVSWLTSKMEWLRNPIGFLGIPWALLADTFINLMPSMGEVQSKAAKQMLVQSWPYSWECWKFQSGTTNLYDPKNNCLREVIRRISWHEPFMDLTVERIAAGEALDTHIC